MYNMKYKYQPYKIIHFDPIQNLIGKGWLRPKPKVHYEIFPITPKKELPVLFRWTVRIINNDTNDILFSCIGEGRYFLIFEKGEDPIKDIRNLIGTSSINLEMRWENETNGTTLYGQTLIPHEESIIKKITEDIIEDAKSQGLL